jgi:hypothetical protein
VPEDFDEDDEDAHGALALEFFAKSIEHFFESGEEKHPEQVEELKRRYGTPALLECKSGSGLADGGL